MQMYESSPVNETVERNKIMMTCTLPKLKVLERFARLLIPIQDFLETKRMLAKYSTMKGN